MFGCHVTAQTAKSLKNSIKLSKNSATMQFEMNNGEPVHKRGALIVLEGLDRCGKTTQCSRLLSFLKGRGLSVESWRFPDRNTDIGRMISSYLANGSQLDDQTVHLLFCANRWEKRFFSSTHFLYNVHKSWFDTIFKLYLATVLSKFTLKLSLQFCVAVCT